MAEGATGFRPQPDVAERLVRIGEEERFFPALDSGERNKSKSNWNRPLPRFRDHPLGVVDIPNAGEYTLSLQPTGKVEENGISFERITLNPWP